MLQHEKQFNENIRNNFETVVIYHIHIVLYSRMQIDCMLLECRYILFAYSFLVLHPITCIFIIGSLKYSWEQCVMAHTYMLVSYAIAIQAHVSYNHTYYHVSLPSTYCTL